MASALDKSCGEFRHYLKNILLPAAQDFDSGVRAGRLSLHQVFSLNYFIAHAVDYIHAIRQADGFSGGRSELVRKFDQIFSVGGLRLGNRKFELIDAVNNALKHIHLDQKRYKDVEAVYGPISFNCLAETGGSVICMLEGYRFDYAKVVLVPAMEALRSADIRSVEGIARYARGLVRPRQKLVSYSDDFDAADPSDAIDRMIDYCNPPCRECGESEGSCFCATYVFEGEAANFEPMFDVSFDFDAVMSQISGAYSRD